MTRFMIARRLAIWKVMASFIEREDGQDMLEYGLIAALISLIAIAIVILLGPSLQNLFQDVVNGLGSA